MKPFRAGQNLANWILRIGLIAYLFVTQIHTFSSFNLNSFSFYLSAVFLIFSVTLLIGAFLSKQSLTVLSALIIFIASAYLLVINFSGSITEYITSLLLVAGISFYFFSNGN